MNYNKFGFSCFLIVTTIILIGCPKSEVNLQFEDNGGRTKEKKISLLDGQVELKLQAFSLWGKFDNYTMKLQADLDYNDSLEQKLSYKKDAVKLTFEGQKVPKFSDEIFDSGFDEVNKTKRISYGFQVDPSKIDFKISSRENPDEAMITINIDGLILFNNSPIKIGAINAYDTKLALWKERILREEARGKN